MKTVWKVLKYFVSGLLVLLLLAVAVFNLVYQQRYAAGLRQEAALKKWETKSGPGAEIDSSDQQVNILPRPKRLIRQSGSFQMPEKLSFTVADPLQEAVAEYCSRLLKRSAAPSTAGLLRFEQLEELSPQAYTLRINPRNIVIQYSRPAGLYYALTSLQQLRQINGEDIPCVIIEDEPAMEFRGVMLDISRDKVPTLETLFALIDYLSLLKYNHLQLYVEGFSFAYPSYRELWEGKETPLTPEEIRRLDRYCQERFIDLTPNQNSFGHMQAWLATERFADLAECPKGFNITPFLNMKMTLDPGDPRSIQLVEQMMEDMLPNFRSSHFNANLDEPFELGKCKSKKAAKEKGVGRVYLEFVEKVHVLSQKHDKKMMMWADVASRHPDILKDIPKDITLLEWGYEAEHPFDLNGGTIRKNGLDLLVCPGTSSWTSLTGRTDNMYGNIDNAVENGVALGARGMLLTDWGDLGHWQYLPVSYAPFAYGASKSWNVEGVAESQLIHFLDKQVFQDQAGLMGQTALDLGRYNQFEERLLPNFTYSFMAYQFGLQDRVLQESVFRAIIKSISNLVGETNANRVAPRLERRQPFRYEEMSAYLAGLEQQLEAVQMTISSGDLVREEFQNGLAMVRLGALVNQYSMQSAQWTSSERVDRLKYMSEQCGKIKSEHERLWLSRNRPGGLKRSMAALEKLDKQIAEKMAVESRGGLSRGWDRFKNRTIAGAAALLL